MIVHKKKTLVPVLGVVLGLVALACTSNSSSGASGSTTPQVLTFATTASVTTWDPTQSFSTEATYMPNLYEGLLVVNPPGSAEAYTPALATSWEHSQDGLTWTWHLRTGVTFHDGSTFDASAAKKSIDYEAKNAAASFIWAPLKTVKVIDANTIEMDLSYAAPMELIVGSTYGAWMVSPTAIDGVTKNSKYFDKGIDAGTGPYTLDGYTPDQEVDFKAYPNYWGGWDGPHVTDVVAKIVPEAAQQQQQLQGGDVDLATRVPPESLTTFASDPNFAVTSDPSWFNYTAFFNTLRPPLDNPKVRAALSYAIPYQDIINVAFLGLRLTVLRCGTQGRVPVQRPNPAVHDRPDQSSPDAVGRGISERRFHAEPDLRVREPGGGQDRAADPGLLQEDRRHGQREGDPVQPAVGGGEV